MVGGLDLEGIAEAAKGQGQFELAARLLGSAAGIRDLIKAPSMPSERAHIERIMAAVQGALDAQVFTAAFEEGRGMPLERSVRKALAVAAAVRAGGATRTRPRLAAAPSPSGSYRWRR